VGNSHHLLLDLIKEYGLELYLSPHALGNAVQTIALPGVCWDCMILPQKGDQENATLLIQAAEEAPPALKQDLHELVNVMAALRQLVKQVNAKQPWLSRNADELDNMTFLEWVEDQTNSTLARDVMKVAVTELGGTMSEASWTSILHIARCSELAPQVSDICWRSDH
jgi:hypothetical protein